MTTENQEPKSTPNLPAIASEQVTAIVEAPQADVAAAPITAAQAKVEAIAHLTMSAYQRAATLTIPPDESKALQERFPDEAFKPGAGGNEHLIYIEHAFLRDRLNKVLGIGQWALIPRNRWAEEFDYFDKRSGHRAKGTRIYVEAMLVVRGAFVSEAVGSMDYYPNQATNYGDAVEGAKTAALRRCCKEFGVGLQAWEKDFCDGWWQRRRQPKQPATAPSATKPAAPTESPEQRKARWIKTCIEAGGGRPDYGTEYYRQTGTIEPDEVLQDIALDRLPKTRAEAEAALAAIRAMAGVGEPPEQHRPPDDPGMDGGEPSDEPEQWREYTVPFGKHSGIPLGELDKKALYGFWANFQVETEYQGRPRKPEQIERDQEFRDMLDEAGSHYEFTKKN